jgi:hypothetical protein
VLRDLESVKALVEQLIQQEERLHERHLETLAIRSNLKDLSGKSEALFGSSAGYQCLLSKDRSRSTLNIITTSDFATLSEAFCELKTQTDFQQSLLDLGREFHRAAKQVQENSTLDPEERESSRRLLLDFEARLW